MKSIRSAVLCVLVLGVSLIGCKSTASSGGNSNNSGGGDSSAVSTPAQDFRDPSQLAADLKQMVDNRLADPQDPHYSPGVTVDSVQCEPINGSKTDFQCVDKLSDNSTDGDEAIVAPDGQSYVTK